MSENRLHKSANQRVRYRLARFCLRNEQSPYEEWMMRISMILISPLMSLPEITRSRFPANVAE